MRGEPIVETGTVTRAAPNPIAQIVLSSRPVSWINTAFPFAAAYLLTTGSVDALFVVGTIFFLIPYNLLMYGVNDVFDYASDRLNQHEGKINLAKNDIALHVLANWDDVLDTGLAKNYFTAQQNTQIVDFLQDPENWGRKMGFV